jgi:hypothetical protein
VISFGYIKSRSGAYSLRTLRGGGGASVGSQLGHRPRKRKTIQLCREPSSPSAQFKAFDARIERVPSARADAAGDVWRNLN